MRSKKHEISQPSPFVGHANTIKATHDKTKRRLRQSTRAGAAIRLQNGAWILHWLLTRLNAGTI